VRRKTVICYRRYFPSDTAYRELLEAEGFDVESCMLVYRPTTLPTNVVGWLETFCTSFMDLVPEQRRQQVEHRRSTWRCFRDRSAAGRAAQCILGKRCHMCTVAIHVQHALLLDCAQVLEMVAAAVVPNVTDSGGKHVIDYVRCRVVAHAPIS